jgi:hypothetical protein
MVLLYYSHTFLEKNLEKWLVWLNGMFRSDKNQANNGILT